MAKRLLLVALLGFWILALPVLYGFGAAGGLFVYATSAANAGESEIELAQQIGGFLFCGVGTLLLLLWGWAMARQPSTITKTILVLLFLVLTIPIVFQFGCFAGIGGYSLFLGDNEVGMGIIGFLLGIAFTIVWAIMIAVCWLRFVDVPRKVGS